MSPEEKEDVTPVEAPLVIVRDNKVPPRVGGDVLYVLALHDSPTNAGRVRPAKIVELTDDGSVGGLVNLQVFTNGGFDQLPNVHHTKNVIHDEQDHKQGTWHWPPPRQLVFQARQEEQIPEDPISGEAMVGLETDAPPPSPRELPTGVEFASLKEPFTTEPDSATRRLDEHIDKSGYHVSEQPLPSSDDEEKHDDA